VRRTTLALGVFSSCSLAVSTSSAAGNPFGAPSEVAVSNDASLAVTGQSQSDGNLSTFSFTIAPAADYFVIRGLSLGLAAFYMHLRARTQQRRPAAPRP